MTTNNAAAETTETQTLSARILSLIAMNPGMTAVEALRIVCGANVVDQMIDSLYYELRAKAVRS